MDETARPRGDLVREPVGDPRTRSCRRRQWDVACCDAPLRK
jgi:hypothetical protein